MSTPVRSVAGVDAIMIYAARPEQLARWYARCLGIKTARNPDDGNYYGEIGDARRTPVHFGIYSDRSPRVRGRARRASPASTGVMVNYRVADLDAVLRSLRARRVKIRDVQQESYGVFAHLDDPEGNPIELWMEQPRPSARHGSARARRSAR